jgi:two-component system, OmpR family, phosphate regulon sensor histidine kinase PhoR
MDGRLTQNLLENAVKYGREGGTIRMAAQPTPRGARWPARPGVVMSVTDDGQGIAREHIPRLTEGSTGWTKAAPALPAAPAWGWRP